MRLGKQEELNQQSTTNENVGQIEPVIQTNSETSVAVENQPIPKEVVPISNEWITIHPDGREEYHKTINILTLRNIVWLVEGSPVPDCEVITKFSKKNQNL